MNTLVVRPGALKIRDPLNRREFVSVCATPLLLAHVGLGHILAESATAPIRKTAQPKILELDLATAAPLGEMKSFYHGVLGLELIEESASHLILRAGLTRLTFRATNAEAGHAPFYHFAFNIPENKIAAALRWQSERSAIIPVPETLRDPSYPPEIVNYSHWNAHSVFFFDPAENVVEYIARHDLKNGEAGSFSNKDILYASEIAFIVDDVPSSARNIARAAGSKIYRGASDVFTPVGDEYGLLLVMKRGRLLSLASPRKKEAAVFATRVKVRGQEVGKHSLTGFPYNITIVSG